MRFVQAACGAIAVLMLSATAFVLGQQFESSAPVEVQPLVVVVPADVQVDTGSGLPPGNGIIEINK